jgi:hypothetical protein
VPGQLIAVEDVVASETSAQKRVSPGQFVIPASNSVLTPPTSMKTLSLYMVLAVVHVELVGFLSNPLLEATVKLIVRIATIAAKAKIERFINENFKIEEMI